MSTRVEEAYRRFVGLPTFVVIRGHVYYKTGLKPKPNEPRADLVQVSDALPRIQRPEEGQ